MTGELIIKVVDPDYDYLGIEIRASNGQFAGSARIYAGLDQLTAFADHISGSPTHPRDERMYQFGDPNRSVAGGYVALRFHCLDLLGHAAVQIEFQDKDGSCGPERANLSFRIEAAGIDQFAEMLRELEKGHSGEAVLPSAR